MVKKSVIPLFVLGAAACSLLVPGALAQQVLQNHEWCDDEGWGSRNTEQSCEVREFTLSADREVIRVDGEMNGGIRVEGWSRDEIQILVKVQAWSRRGDPTEIASQVEIGTGSTIRASGPDMQNREGWSASYRLMVPQQMNLDLRAFNGGIGIADVSGELRFETLNGGLTLTNVGGDVRGETTNGSVHVTLSGSEWDGAGLDVETTNGGVVLEIPEDFRATVQSGTVHGGFDTDIPFTVQGRLRSRRLTADLNGGGQPIRVVTTNGSVRIRSR
jgi:hypothetical protein